MSNDTSIKIPIWMAALLMSAILAIAGDTWRSVQAVKSDLQCLKTALAAKGLIDPSICLDQAQDAAQTAIEYDTGSIDPACRWVIYGVYMGDPQELTLSECAIFHELAWMELPP